MSRLVFDKDLSGLPAWVAWPIADRNKLYVRVEVMIPAGVLSEFFSSTPDLVVISEDDTTVDPFATSSTFEFVRFALPHPIRWRENWGADADFTTTVTEETWHTIEVWLDSPNLTGYCRIDSEFSDFTVNAPSGVFKSVTVGLMNNNIDGYLWVRRIKIGTTDGAGDLVDYDASSDPAAFGFTIEGDVTLETSGLSATLEVVEETDSAELLSVVPNVSFRPLRDGSLTGERYLYGWAIRRRQRRPG